MDDIRSEKRTKILFQIEFGSNPVSLPDGKAATGEMINIGGHGACIITNAIPDNKESIEFDIKIPDKLKKILNIESCIPVRASVIWKHGQNNTEKPAKYGIKFINKDMYSSSIEKIIDYENNKLSNKNWDCSHPDTVFPSISISSEMLEGMKPSAISVDVTNLCNLNCKHCFWDEYQRQVHQKTNLKILDSVKEVLDRFKSITNILWYGGEPLINDQTRNIIKEGIKLIKNNLIITNGTFPFPDFKENVHYAVSIDGTEKVHNFLRGKEIYNKIKDNIQTALNNDVPLGLLYCINAYNIDVIPDFLEEWADQNLLGFCFTVYTPLRNKNSYLTPTDEQRYAMINILQEMKKKYGDLIINSDKMIELLDPKYGEELAKECPMNLFNTKSRVYCLHLCNDGTIRIPCSLGHDASHVECRSITKIGLYAGTILNDRKSYRSLLRMYLSNYHNRKKKNDSKNSKLIELRY